MDREHGPDRDGDGRAGTALSAPAGDVIRASDRKPPDSGGFSRYGLVADIGTGKLPLALLDIGGSLC